MKILIACTACALVCMAYAIKPGNYSIDNAARANLLRYKQTYSFSCSPVLSDLDLEDAANAIPLLTGWGNYRMPVTVGNDSANIYFQQGINMYYAFHIIEALASFEKSVTFDTSFAMGYWGKALAYGPNINDLGYSASPDALVAAAKAKLHFTNCTPAEKALVEAMQVRYSADTTRSRAYLNQLYADAMKKVYQQYPANADAGALYVDAMMLQHPWDLYDKYGQPKTWTPPIVQTLEAILHKYPKHPGACHYYVHSVEASAHPEVALAVADTLETLMPGVSHLVHMPSHIYIRSGHYAKGVDVNRQSIKGYEDYLSKFPAVANNTPLYVIHNRHMEAACANMDGRFADALKASYDCRNSFDSAWQGMPGFFGIAVQFVYMTPYLTQVHFGKWDDVLRTPEPPKENVYASALWHYGRCVAFARRHIFDSANNELEGLRQNMKNDQMLAPPPAYSNAGIKTTGVAEKIMMGIIAEEQNNLPQAIGLLTEAVDLEDALQYNEPRDWQQPARHFLGSVLIKAGKYAEAEKVYKRDLEINPHNGWALTGLAQALAKQGKKKEAATTKLAAAKAFERNDVIIEHSVFY